MLIKFARPYFSRAGVHYPARQIVEVPDDEFQKRSDGKASDKDKGLALPSGAEVFDAPKDFELPPNAPPTLPGYGGKPLHHEKLAQVGAEPTHLLTEATGGPAVGAVMTDPAAKSDTKTVQTSAKAGEKADTKVASAKDDKSSKDPAKDL